MALRKRALVTGASAGIGQAFAERLAADRYDLVILARRRDRLDALAGRLHEAHGVDVDVVEADLTGDEDLRRAEKMIAGDEQLSLLVNNAGFGAYGSFATLDPDTAEDLVRVHVLSVVRLTRAALPGMMARGEGAVITIASMLAFSGTMPPKPLPARATYAGSKAFQVAFSQALAGELAGSGVRVLVCCPGVVKTEFHEIQDMDLSKAPRMSPEDVVQAALAALANGENLCSPGVDDVAAWDHLANAQISAFSSAQPALAPRYRRR